MLTDCSATGAESGTARPAPFARQANRGRGQQLAARAVRKASSSTGRGRGRAGFGLGRGNADIREASQQNEASPAVRMPLAAVPRSAMGTELVLRHGAGSAQLASTMAAPAARPVKRRRPAQRLYTAETMLSPWEAAEAAEKLREEQEDAELLKDMRGL